MSGEESLATMKLIRTLGSYWPCATSVFSYIRRAMPFYNPQSLSDEKTYAITAYVFFLNDLVDEEFELNSESIMEIEMPNSTGFYGPDPRPDVQNVACMKNCVTGQGL